VDLDDGSAYAGEENAHSDNFVVERSMREASTSKPLFSVIIPTYDRLELLIRAVGSVRQQSFRDFEIIVVDDGSGDGTREWLVANKSWLRRILQSNKGPGAARNAGAQIATGQYLAFLDSDDMWFPWTLGAYREAIDRCCWPSFLAGKPHVFSDERECEIVKSESLKVERFEDYLASGREWRWWGVSSFVISREMFLRVGGFIEDRVNSEDADLALRLGVATGFVQITAPATFAYRVHAANMKDNLGRTLAGIRYILNAEKGDQYPGGRARARERRVILTRHMRPVALEGLREGNQREAWRLYVSTFAWNVSLGRFRYLVAFPLIAVIKSGRRILAALDGLRPC
jgi:glycosyltransferase involved in cell wall biosynthesis